MGGSTTGLSELRDVSCRNSTEGQAMLIDMRENGVDWDCEAEGLEVNPDDEVWMLIRGRAD